MRALVYFILFNLVCNLAYSFEIEGDINENIRLKIEEYANKKRYDDIKTLLESLNVYSYELNEEKLEIFESLNVDKLRLHGNINFLDSTIISAAAFYDNSPVYLDTFENYTDKIRKFYKDNGFLDVEVYYKFNNGILDIFINEGKLYVLTEMAVYYKDKEIYSEKFIIPKILTQELIDGIKEQELKKIKKDGILFPDYQIYYEKSTGRPFLDLNFPLNSILSILPSFHKTVSLVIKINESKRYNFNIKGLPENLIDKAIDIVVKNLKNPDSYSVGKTYLALIDEFGSDLFFNLDDNEIVVNVNSLKQKEKYKYDVKINGGVNPDGIISVLNEEQLSDVPEIKNLLQNILNGIGYYLYDLTISREKNSLLIDINLKDKARIGNVYLNDKTFLTNFNEFYSNKAKNAILNEIKNKLREEYYYNYIIEDKVVYNKDNNTVDIYFKSDFKKLYLRDVLTEDKRITKIILKRIKRGEVVTIKKIENIRYVIKNSLNINDYRLSVIQDNEDADIVFGFKKAKKNLMFIDLQYNNVDQFILSLGYKRFGVLGTEYVLDSSVTFSKKEESYLLGLSKLSKLYDNILKINYSTNYFKKDMDDFKYKGLRFGYMESIYGESFRLDYGLFAENLKIYDANFANNHYNKKYRFLKIPLKYSFNKLNSNLLLFPFSVSIDNNMLLESDFSLLTVETNFFLQKKIWGNFYTSLDLNAGKILGNTESTPLLYRFTLGGQKMMKAFSLRELGPEDELGNVYGGTGYFHLNFGMPYEIVENVMIGPFFEAGKVYYESGSTPFYKDVGLMFNVDMGIGDISISYAKSFSQWGKTSSAFYITLRGRF